MTAPQTQAAFHEPPRKIRTNITFSLHNTTCAQAAFESKLQNQCKNYTNNTFSPNTPEVTQTSSQSKAYNFRNETLQILHSLQTTSYAYKQHFNQGRKIIAKTK